MLKQGLDFVGINLKQFHYQNILFRISQTKKLKIHYCTKLHMHLREKNGHNHVWQQKARENVMLRDYIMVKQG